MQRYELIQSIINGSTCMVYRGRTLNHVAVAVKLVDDDALGLKEAKMLGRFSHPNIIKMLDSNWFMCPRDKIMKFGIVLPVLGKDLRSFLNHMSDTMDASMMKRVQTQIKLQTARALHHVHNEGVIHGDLKPENIGMEYSPAGKVHIQLMDFGSAICIADAEFSTSTMRVKTTRAYQAPETTRKDSPIISSCGDIYSLGKIFCELEITSEPEEENQVSRSVPLEFFSPLARDMVQHDFRRRPTSLKILVRLGESTELLCVDNDCWENPAVNCMADKMDVISSKSYDKSVGLHRLITLVRSDKSKDIKAAFWLLHAVACEEGSSLLFPQQSVLSILPYFHSRLHVCDNEPSTSAINKLMYCTALAALCERSYFILSDDAKLSLRALSAISICERTVLLVIAKSAARCPELLEWCVEGKWGKFGDRFEDFAMRFTDDWSKTAEETSRALLGLPPRETNFEQTT